jgi:hypothetical protein
MPHVITRPCCNDASRVAVCPVNRVHPAPDEPEYGTSGMGGFQPRGCGPARTGPFRDEEKLSQAREAIPPPA